MADKTVMAIEHIVKTPGVCGGRARIDGTRLTVELIVSLIQEGATVHEIVDGYQHVGLTPAQVYAVLSYYHDHREEIETEINASDAIAKEGIARQKERDAARGNAGRLSFEIDPARFLTAQAAARELGLKDASSIRKLIADGDLAAQKFPPEATQRGVWLVERESLEALKARRQARREEGGAGRPPKSG